MDITITFESAVPRESVAIHAWEPLGHVWDVTARQSAGRRFTFRLRGTTADVRTVQFKFRFPGERRWEPDDYVRHVPTRRASAFWAFDYSPRVMIRDPYVGSAPERVRVILQTAARLAGGRLFAWRPGATGQVFVNESARSPAGVSTFDVPVAPWMREGFHFKFVSAGGEFEPDRASRVWRPGDGDTVYVKSGQASVRPRPLQRLPLRIDLLYPRTLGAPPALRLRDRVEAYSERLTASAAPTPLSEDARFARATYAASVFPEAGYTLAVESGPHGAVESADIRRPIRVAATDAGDQLRFTALLGYDQWLTQVPPVATVRLVYHAPPQAPPDELSFHVGVGSSTPYETLRAVRRNDGTWAAETTAFVGVPLFAEPDVRPAADRRADGPVSRRRPFRIDEARPTELQTADGRSGFAAAPAAPPPPAAAPPVPAQADPPLPRATLMSAAFTAAIVAAGVFGPHELPHGATRVGQEVYFVLYAPHAVRLSLVLLSSANIRSLVPMQPTTDNRYWWCRLPLAQVPVGQRYRFLQNDNVEVLDPATRWAVNPAQELWANVGEGDGRAWSLYVDRDTLRAPLAGDGWRTLPWESLIIYELHPLRFTVRNANVNDGLDQVAAELGPGRYLRNLGVTALEFLPLHEFSKGSWGYNPSLFFSIDADYGGPQALARCVAAAHAAGKGVVLDVVYNHMEQSPLQALAGDVYVDGETWWGAQVNYDHPSCMEFFRQATVYLWDTFGLDGIRFDSTRAMLDGDRIIDGVIRVGGSGHGWEFLNYLRDALRKSADATGRPWPYCVGEQDPNDWPMTNNSNGGVLDGQWAFHTHYPLADAAWNGDDKSEPIIQSLNVPHEWLRPFSEAVRYGESHDSCGHRDDSKRRLARRAPFGQGFQMAKAVGTVALLAVGVPMLFMGQEGGEDNDFYFDYDPALDRGNETFFARISRYEDLGDGRNRVFAWFRDLIDLRSNSGNNLGGNDDQRVGRGFKTVAFTRAGGRFFVIATFGTPDTRQTLGWLGLPSGATYKEVFNSSWPAYQASNEGEFANGGYDAVLSGGSVVNVPPIGGIVLERR